MKKNNDLELPPGASLGERIRYYRKLEGLTQEELAFRAETSTSRIGSIERGESEPQLKTVKRIAEALNKPVEAMYEDLYSPEMESDLEIKENINLILEYYAKADDNGRKFVELSMQMTAQGCERLLRK